MIQVNLTAYMRQNDLLPPLRGQLLNAETGAPQDLTGASAVVLHLRNKALQTIKINAAVVVESAKQGRWRYDWTGSDTDTAGEFEGEIQATFAGKPLTGPTQGVFTVTIAPEIA